LAALGISSHGFASQRPSAPAQTPQKRPSDQDQSVRLKADLIQLRAVVMDRKGKLIDDLKKEDFEVLENGAAQQISFFSAEKTIGQPGSGAGGNRPPAPGTRPRLAAGEPVRTIVLLVDNLHLSFSSLATSKQQLKRFIDEQITDQDLVAVVATSGTLGVLQQFMKDRKRLKYAIDKISLTTGKDSLFTPFIAAKVLDGDPSAISVAIQIVTAEEGYLPMGFQADRAYVEARANQIMAQAANLRRVSLLTLKGVSDRLAEMPGQRIISFVSDGFTLLAAGGGADNYDLQAAIGRASRSGVIIYSFDAKGLEAPAEYSAAVGVSGPLFSSYMAESRLDQQAVLRTVSDDTGGEAYVNHNDMNRTLQTMLDNNRVYYSIAFYQPEGNATNKLRKVSLRVKGHPEYVVRSQKGYMPPEGKDQEVAASPREKLFQAMIAPMPAANIGVASSADFLERESDDAQVTFQAHIDGSSLRYQRQPEGYLLHCEIEVVVFDGTGKISTSFADTVKGMLTADQFERAKRNGYRYTNRVNLKPGLYQFRAGVREVGTELIGTSVSWVEVPDLSKHKMALSGIFLGRPPGANQSQAASPAEGRAAGPDPITGAATFKSGQQAYYRFVVYNADPDRTAGTAPSLKIEILRGERTIYNGTASLASRAIRRDAKGIEVGGQLNLGLEPGVYTLRISAKDSKSKKPAQQTVDFEIE